MLKDVRNMMLFKWETSSAAHPKVDGFSQASGVLDKPMLSGRPQIKAPFSSSIRGGVYEGR